MSVERLRAIAEKAGDSDTYGGPWTFVSRPLLSGQNAPPRELLVGSSSEMGHIAEVVWWAPHLAEHIATFDPPTVLALLDIAEAAQYCLGPEFDDLTMDRAVAHLDALADLLDRLREVTS